MIPSNLPTGSNTDNRITPPPSRSAIIADHPYTERVNESALPLITASAALPPQNQRVINEEDWQLFDQMYANFNTNPEERHNYLISWIESHPTVFSQDTFNTLPLAKQCRLTVILTEETVRRLPHSTKNDIQNLSIEMRTLAQQAEEPAHLHLARIIRLFSPDLAPVAAAAIINYHSLGITKIIADLSSLTLNRDKFLNQLAPHLLYVNVQSCDTITRDFLEEWITKCSNATLLNISQTTIQTLPLLTYCKTLYCVNCRYLTTINGLPECEHLDCYNCSQLNTLPPLPKCRFLDCSRCPLINIPPLPECRCLRCTNCRSLTKIESLPECNHLKCQYCPQLSTLPPLPKCLGLDCNDCQQLTSLPELLQCRNLNCSSCKELTTIQELPQCLELNCSHCEQLTTISSAPLLVTLNIEECTSLTTIPTLRRRSNVYGLHNNAYILHVDAEKLKIDPRRYLMDLGNRFLLTDHFFPGIVYMGDSAIAIDIGGVRRHFISELFENLFTERGLPTTQNPLMPTIGGSETREETLRAYRIIGTFFALCYEGSNSFVIGEIFDEVFFMLMKLLATQMPSDEMLLKSYLILRCPNTTIYNAIHQKIDSPDKVLNNNAITYWNAFFADKPESVSEKNHLVNQAKQDGRIKAIHTIAYAMHCKLSASHQREFAANSPHDLQTRIQGKLNKELLLNRVIWIAPSNLSPTNTDVLQTQNWFTEWVNDTATDIQTLRKFVKAVTGSNTLAQNCTITVNMHNLIGRVPVAHTCSKTLDLAYQYESSQKLREHLNYVIASCDTFELS